MARTTETSIQATGLSQPDIGAASFVRQAPVDISGAVGANVTAAALGMQAAGIQSDTQALASISRTIPQAVEMGLDIHKNLARTAMHEEMNAEIDATREAANNPELALATIGGIDLAQQSLWNKMGDKQTNVQDITKQQANFEKETQVLQKAFSQGAIDASGLRMRLLDITRQHINKNPGLMNELLAHSEKVLSISGVSSLRDTKKKLDDSASKAFEKQKDTLIKQGNALNVEMDILDLDTPEKLGALQDKINAERRSLSSYQDVTQSDKIRQIKTNQQAMQFTASRGQDLLKGASMAYHFDARAIVAAFKDDPKSIPGALSELAQQHKDQARETLGPLVALDPDGAGKLFTEYERTINATLERITKVQTGEDYLTVLNNANKIQDQLNLAVLNRSGINTAVIDFAGKNQIMDRWAVKNPQVFDRMLATTGAIIFNNPEDNSLLEAMTLRSQPDGVIDTVGFAKDLSKQGKVDEFKQALSVYAQATIGGRMTQDQVVNFTDSFITEFSKREIGEQVRKNASKEDILRVNEMAGQYMTYYSQAIAAKRVGQNVQVNEIPGIGINYKVPDNPQLERQLNHLYANKINNLTKTVANIGGMTHEQAWQFVRNEYAQQLGIQGEGEKSTGKRGQNENNPLNLKVPGKNEFQSFSTKTEGLKASFNQLLKYNDGTSANVDRPLTTPLEMLRVWNNAAEKGSATDKQYASNVARASGLDLTQDIDKNDTDSWVDLLYGMSVAEGAKNVTRKEIRQALQGGM